MDFTVTSVLILILLAISIFEVSMSVRGCCRNKKHNQHFLSNGVLIRMADILVGCPVEFVYKHSKLISSSSTYCFEPNGNSRTIVGHELVSDPFDKERMLTIFITDSEVFPYFLADECDLIDLVDARIHFKGVLEPHTDDDDCVTAVDGHIEESEADLDDSESLKEPKCVSKLFSDAKKFKY